MLPLGFFKNRTQVGGGIAIMLMMIPFLSATYYLPFFYQAKGRTASQSGIDIIPFMLSAILASFISGGIVNGTGHYLTMLLIGPLVSSVGAGLLFTITEYMSNRQLIGYQILFGVGLGVAFQLPLMAIQAEYADKPELIPQASSLLSFLQLIGGVIGIAISGTIFNNKLNTELAIYVSGLSPEMLVLVKQSVTFIFTLPKEAQVMVVHAYVKALDYVFILSIPACILASVAGAFVRNWNLKARGGGMAAGAV
jgi:MFS family permease